MTVDPVHIYGPRFSNFVRSVMLVCEEKEIAYTVGFEVDGSNIAFKGEQHLKWHPFGKIPVLLEGKLALPETASICRYLDEDKQLQPHQNSQVHAQHDALCALISIDIDKILVRDYLLEFAFPKGENNSIRFDVVKEVQPKAAAIFAIIEQVLQQETALTSKDFTIADALLAPMLHYISCLPTGFDLITDYPKVEQYLANVMARPSCQKVLTAKEF
ncbi:glutathione S-transferase family protein [Colwellia sp. Bg11-28]|uniref:glutathione S-transferase family protein n=1 Tax=Colwellia sp. Bg11-28 TaxID=2058305 RepID=UPI000C33FFE7|nr:glutathione S-transferase family protein [Colwellia sp. Bg11-28]PKH88354.1 glutathione S-transferase family protein [Colwellia sp. Bg11-28]